MAFYRTYRPQLIGELDNPHVRAQLTALLSKDRADLPHAYMFTGPKGTGKTTTARLLAKLFNCHELKKTGPCGACESCISIARGTSIDVIEIDAASNRGIDEMRTLRERIGLAPSGGGYKVYIIDEVHMLTPEAFNALLKTLEEPPKHAVFVLATTDPQKVPETIMSRCVHVSFQRADGTQLQNVIAKIAKAEKLTLDSQSLELIAMASDGSFRDAAKLLEQVSLSHKTITADIVRSVLSLSDSAVRVLMIDHLASHNTPAVLDDIETLKNSGHDLKAFTADLLSDLERLLVETAKGHAQAGWTQESITQAITGLVRAYDEFRSSPIPQLPLEIFAVEFSQPHADTQPLATPNESATFTPRTESSSGPHPAVQVADMAVHVTPMYGMLTMEKLVDHWPDVIASVKPYNHSVAGVLRSSRPKGVAGGIVTIEAFYKFHQEKLAEVATKQMLGDLLKKLFGEKVKVEIILGKK